MGLCYGFIRSLLPKPDSSVEICQLKIHFFERGLGSLIVLQASVAAGSSHAVDVPSGTPSVLATNLVWI